MALTTSTPGTVSITTIGNVQTVQGRGDVVVPGDADSVATIEQIGNDLMVGLRNGEMFRIVGYFTQQDAIDIFFVDQNENVLQVVDVRGGGDTPLLLQFEDPAELAAGGGDNAVLGILAAVAALGVAAAAGGGGDGPEMPPPEPTDILARNDTDNVRVTVRGTETTFKNPASLSGSTDTLLGVLAVDDAIDLGALNESTVFSFRVAPGTEFTELKFSGSGEKLAGVQLGGSQDLDIRIFQQLDGASVATEFRVLEGALVFDATLNLGLVTLDGGWTTDLANPMSLMVPSLPGGATYFVVVGQDGVIADVDLGAEITLRVDTVTVQTSNGEVVSSEEVSGNVISENDIAPSGTRVTSVDDTIVRNDGTTIEGQFGTLTIDLDGSYQYDVDVDATFVDGSRDVFEYTITSPDGETSRANLTITLSVFTETGPSGLAFSASDGGTMVSPDPEVDSFLGSLIGDLLEETTSSII